MRCFFVLSLFFSVYGLRDIKSIQRNELRIAGGTATSIENWPFMASTYHTLPTTLTYYACGATILTRTTLISAASCFWGDAPSAWKAKVGSSFTDGETGLFYQVGAITCHESFTFSSMDYDVALLTLTSQLTYTDSVQPAYLAGTSFVNLPEGESLSVVGWGATEEYGEKSIVLHTTSVQKSNSQYCASVYNEIRQTNSLQSRIPNVTDRMVCAELTVLGGNDACHGDAGSPLVYQRNVVIGIVSWGLGCGVNPGVYTHVPQILSWVTANGNN